MKKILILGLLCLSVVGGYAQDDDSDDWKVGGKHYQEWEAKQTCTEVCGVRFGSSYENAKEILKRKYGEPDYLETNENAIVYHYKSYGGMIFTNIYFCFQRDGALSYMNQCVMGYDCKTAEEAKNKRDAIWNKARSKYAAWHEDIDDNGFKYYESGCSPLGGFGNGFVIDVVKYNEPYNGCRYFSRIMYGPYNYVQEDF